MKKARDIIIILIMIIGFGILMRPDMAGEVYAIEGDEEGNQEDEGMASDIDNEPPTLSYSLSGYLEIFGHKYYKNNSVCIDIDVSDNSGEGITIILYRNETDQDGNTYLSEYLTRNVNSGTHKFWVDKDIYRDGIEIKAVDQSDNTSSQGVYDSGLIFDMDSPEISVDMKQADYEVDDILYYKDSCTIKIDISEERFSDSGIGQAYISINEVNYDITDYVTLYDTNTPEKKLHISYNLNLEEIEADNNHYDIQIFTSDNLGNENKKSYQICIDNVAPSVKSVLASGTELLTSKDEYGYVTGTPVVIKIDSLDNEGGSGIREIRYYLDNGRGKPESSNMSDKLSLIDGRYSQLVVPPDYKGKLYLRLIDNVGNESDIIATQAFITESEGAFVDNSEIYIDMPTTEYTDVDGYNLYSEDIIIPVSVTEDYAGISKASYEISIDGEIKEKGEIDSQNVIYDKNLITNVKINMPISFECNDIVLKIIMIGNVGYRLEKEVRFSIDKTAPVVRIYISSGNNDTVYQDYYNTDVGVTIEIEDVNYTESMVSLDINGNIYDISQYKTEDINNISYGGKYHIVLSEDNKYDLKLDVCDRARNMSDRAGLECYVDKTAPKISVIYEDEGDAYYYNHNRKAIVYVEDVNTDMERVIISSTNLGSITASYNNELSLYFDEDGRYSYTIDAYDKAGNRSEQYISDTFIIDMQSPSILIDGIEDGHSYNGVLEAGVLVQDMYIDKESIDVKISGVNNDYCQEKDTIGMVSEDDTKCSFQIDDLPYDKKYDGKYMISVYCSDYAENEAGSIVVFNMNRYGSDYYIDDDTNMLNGQYLKTTDDLYIYESNVDQLAKYSVCVIHNGITEELGEEAYNLSSIMDGDRYKYTYKINKDNFLQDGSYRIVVSSVDNAGNTNISSSIDNGCSLGFIIDNTCPIINSMNLVSGDIVEEESYEEEFIIKDNEALDRVTIIVDGEVKSEFMDSQLSGDRYSITLQESGKRQNILVRAVDKAGNVMEYNLDNILVTNNIFITSMEKYNEIIGGFIGLVGFIGLILRNVRKRQVN